MSLVARLRVLASSDPLALAKALNASHFHGDLDTNSLVLEWFDEEAPYAQFRPKTSLRVSKPWWEKHDEDARKRLILHELIHMAVYTLYGETMWRAQHKDQKGHGAMFDAVRRKYGLQQVPLTSDDLE